MRRSQILCAITLPGLILLAWPATADRVVIEYDITGGQIAAGQPATVTGGGFALSYKVDVAPGGPNLSACATTAVIPGYVIDPGSTLLLALSLDFSLQYQGGSGVWNTDGRLQAPTASLTSSCTFSGVAKLDGATVSIPMAGSQVVTCFSPASYCTYTGYTPGVPQTFDASFYIDSGGGFVWNKQNGTGIISGTGAYTTVSGYQYGGRATVSFVGQEIASGKTFVVPEPSTFLFGATSLATLGGLAATRSTRRRRRAGLAADEPGAAGG